MRKRLVMSILLAVSSPFLFAQGFDKGKIAIDLGAGLGLYGLNSNDKANPNNSSGAGAWLIPVRVEYGLNKRFGIGLYADPQLYISNPDSGDAATGVSIGLLTAFHLYNGKSATLLARLGVGGGGVPVFSSSSTCKKLIHFLAVVRRGNVRQSLLWQVYS